MYYLFISVKTDNDKSLVCRTHSSENGKEHTANEHIQFCYIYLTYIKIGHEQQKPTKLMKVNQDHV